MRGDLKTKVKPLVGSMFGFEVPVDETGRAKNRELAEKLKQGYSYLYKVCSLTTSESYSYFNFVADSSYRYRCCFGPVRGQNYSNRSQYLLLQEPNRHWRRIY